MAEVRHWWSARRLVLARSDVVYDRILSLMREIEQTDLPFFEVFCEDQEVPTIDHV